MSNPLFNQLKNANGPMALVNQFMQFKNSFKGNPQEEVMKIIQSGRYSQEQINQVQNMANQFKNMLGKM